MTSKVGPAGSAFVSSPKTLAAPNGGERHFRFESRPIVPARSSRHGISYSRHLSRNQAQIPLIPLCRFPEPLSNDERKYYLSNLPADATLKVLAAAIKARWVCEQAHQQMKEELGLGHFEDRSWLGLHRHALMTMIAYAFLQHKRLQIAKQEKKKRRVRGGPPEPTLPAVRRALINALAIPTAQIRCPHCQQHFQSENSILPK